MRTRLKFCGLMRSKDVDHAVGLGAHLLGFIHVPGSPRHLDVDPLQELLRRVPADKKTVVVVQDAEPEVLSELRRHLEFDFFQFHGTEPTIYGARFGGYFVAHLDPSRTTAPNQAPPGPFYLLDTKIQGRAGGTGQPFDWSILPQAPGTFLVAGGLNAYNVQDLIQTYRPWGIDVSSGVELEPGVKDHQQMEVLVQRMRSGQSL